MLKRVIYTSMRLDDTDRYGYSPHFPEICSNSIARNVAKGITGILICTPTWYLQVLEGFEYSLEKLLLRINEDTRHFNMTVLASQKISSNSFPDWGMVWVCKAPDTLRYFESCNLNSRMQPQDEHLESLFCLAGSLLDFQQDRIAHTFRVIEELKTTL